MASWIGPGLPLPGDGPGVENSLRAEPSKFLSYLWVIYLYGIIYGIVYGYIYIYMDNIWDNTG